MPDSPTVSNSKLQDAEMNRDRLMRLARAATLFSRGGDEKTADLYPPLLSAVIVCRINSTGKAIQGVGRPPRQTQMTHQKNASRHIAPSRMPNERTVRQMIKACGRSPHHDLMQCGETCEVNSRAKAKNLRTYCMTQSFQLPRASASARVST